MLITLFWWATLCFCLPYFYYQAQLGSEKNMTKYYNWNPEKNQQLKSKRAISFEEIIYHIQKGNEVDILEHPNQERYQKTLSKSENCGCYY
jgi:hypothetical protein